MENINLSFGKRLRALRESRDLTREKLAEGIGITPSSIYDIERGHQWVSPKTLSSMAEFFNVSPAVFFTDDVVRIKPTPLEAWEILGELIQTKQLPLPSDPRIERLLAAITIKPAILDIALDAVRAFESAANDRKRRAPSSSG